MKMLTERDIARLDRRARIEGLLHKEMARGLRYMEANNYQFPPLSLQRRVGKLHEAFLDAGKI